MATNTNDTALGYFQIIGKCEETDDSSYTRTTADGKEETVSKVQLSLIRSDGDEHERHGPRLLPDHRQVRGDRRQLVHPHDGGRQGGDGQQGATLADPI